jgi:hypothetical protein
MFQTIQQLPLEHPELNSAANIPLCTYSSYITAKTTKLLVTKSLVLTTWAEGLHKSLPLLLVCVEVEKDKN